MQINFTAVCPKHIRKNRAKIQTAKMKNLTTKSTEYDAFQIFNLLTVKNPILTKGIIEKLHENKVIDFICINRLLQFLRSKTEMDDEGDYNELMHLSNCDCHSNQFKYLGMVLVLYSSKTYYTEWFHFTAEKNVLYWPRMASNGLALNHERSEWFKGGHKRPFEASIIHFSRL